MDVQMGPGDDVGRQNVRDERIEELLPTWMTPLGSPDPDLPAISITHSPATSAISSMTVRRSRHGIGRYLIDTHVLLLRDEADRAAATSALEEAGFAVLHPVNDVTPGQDLLAAEAKPHGYLGNVISFSVEQTNGVPVKAAIIDLDARELFCLSHLLHDPVRVRLERMGVTIDTAAPTSPLGALSSTLDWYCDFKVRSDEEVDPRHKVPSNIPLRVDPTIVEQLPPGLVASFEEQLRRPTFDPTPVRGKARTGSWEGCNGVLDDDDLRVYRELAPDGVELPDDWEDCWKWAMQISPPHAPILCALLLHDLHPDWWDNLPRTPYQRGGTWLLGHSMSKPLWFRQDLTLDSERRLQCAVALLVKCVGDLTWLRKKSRDKHDCLLCGRTFEPGFLQAGEVYQRGTARICPRCPNANWSWREEDLTVVERAGIHAHLNWIVDNAGGPISTTMISATEYPDSLSEEAIFLLDRRPPSYVLGNWIEWLGASGALGESWRPSFGQYSIASDGHHCRSFLERVIDDWFTAHHIAHEVEPPYPYDDTLNRNGSRADWKLTDGTMVEAAGLLNRPAYADKMERKKLLAARHALDLIIVEEADLVDLSHIFSRHLRD